jgi:hypothetical protein
MLLADCALKPDEAAEAGTNEATAARAKTEAAINP